MAHFALVENGYVTQVMAIHNNDAPDEASGQSFIASMGLPGLWIQTSYNGNPINNQNRGPYAGIGYTWDGVKFAAPITETSTEEIS